MLMHIYRTTDNRYLGAIRSNPKCGEDFCDSCGDCLVCHWEDWCYGNDDGKHLWVNYIKVGDTIPLTNPI